MARHRNVRTMKYEEEFFDEDDVEDCYGQSFDDKYCISPGTAAQFTFSRGSNFDLGSYISGESSPAVPSQVPEIITPKSQAPKVTKKFNDFDEACLNSCFDQVSEIIPNVHPREMVIDCIKKHNYNTEAVLNDLLSSPDAPKPQRQPRQGRRAQEFSSDLYAQSVIPMSECVVCDYDDDDDSDRIIPHHTLVRTMPHYKFRQKYNSVGEEEGSSYSSVNSGDAEDQQSFLSERNGDSLSHNPIVPPLKSGNVSSQNVAPSIESSDDDDLEVDGEVRSVDDCVRVRKMLIDDQIQTMRPSKYISTFRENNPSSTESSDDDLEVDGADCMKIEKKIPSSFGSAKNSSMLCKTGGHFELSDMMTNNSGKILANKLCNDKALESFRTTSTCSKLPAQKSDKEDLLKLFAMANINKQKMEESASSMSDNKKGFSALSKPSLSEEISRSSPLIQNKTNLKSIYDKSLSSSKENSRKIEIFQRKDNNSCSSSCSSSSNNNDDCDRSSVTNKCKECSANQVNSKKGSNKMSLADLTRQRFGSTTKEQVPKNSFFAPSINSSCPKKKNSSLSALPLTTDSSSSQPLIDLTNRRSHEQSSNSSDGKLFSFQSPNSEKKSCKEKDNDKKPVTSLADLMKQRSTTDVSLPPFQSRKEFSLAEIFKKGDGDSCSQETSKKSTDKETPTPLKESEPSFSKISFDIQKIDLSSREVSTNIADENELTVSHSGSKKDCQPMSLGELFSRVNDGKVSNSDTTRNLEDLWQGPSSKPVVDPSHQQESTELDKSLENTSEIKFLLPSFVGVSSEYQKVKTIYEAPASMFGTVVSYHPQTVKYTETIPSPRRKTRYHKFSYKSQMSGMDLNLETKLAPIIPFDFSTPSPDDIIKKHQSQAFCHENIDPQRV